MTHACPAPGCEAQVPPDMLACRRDWFRLPQGLRNRIWAAWDDGAGAGSERHAAAVRDAAEWYQQNGTS